MFRMLRVLALALLHSISRDMSALRGSTRVVVDASGGGEDGGSGQSAPLLSDHMASAEVDKYLPAAQFDWVVHVVAASIPVRALAPVIDNLTLVVAVFPVPSPPAARVVGQPVAAPTAIAVVAVER